MIPALSAWTSFYTVTGSASAALTGLVFIVVTLLTDRVTDESRANGTSAFTTPTVVHFAAAFLLSAGLCAPWRSLVPIGLLVACAGVVGAIYVVRIATRLRTLTIYRPDLEDWTWYVAFPGLAYVAILVGGAALIAGAWGLGFLAVGILLLIAVGIHNAWDTVTYVALRPPPQR